MNHNPIAFTHCTECQFEYKLERVARTQSEMQRRFQLRVARDSTVVFIVIQSVIFLAAFLVRLCDPQERMVKIVGLRQLPGQDMSHGLLNALEHHKTTYYICGLLLCLFLVGVVGTLVAAYYWCCRETNENSTASGSGFMDYYFRRTHSADNRGGALAVIPTNDLGYARAPARSVHGGVLRQDLVWTQQL